MKESVLKLTKRHAKTLQHGRRGRPGKVYKEQADNFYQQEVYRWYFTEKKESNSLVKQAVLQCYALAILIFLLRRCPEFVTGFGFGFLYMIIISIIYHVMSKR